MPERKGELGQLKRPNTCGIRRSSCKRVFFVTFGCYRHLDDLELLESVETQEDCVGAPEKIYEGPLCSAPPGKAIRNSSGVEAFNSSFGSSLLKHQAFKVLRQPCRIDSLIEERRNIELSSTWTRGDCQVTYHGIKSFPITCGILFSSSIQALLCVVYFLRTLVAYLSP